MDSSGIKNQSKFLPLRELSPTVLGSLHLQNRNLEELDMLAQKSVQKRLKSIETFKTEPISIEPPSMFKWNIRGKQKNRKGKYFMSKKQNSHLCLTCQKNKKNTTINGTYPMIKDMYKNQIKLNNIMKVCNDII